QLLTMSEETCIGTIKKEETIIDDDFFSLFARLLETAAYSGDEITGKKMKGLQELLLTNSATGKRLRDESEEIQKAREKLEKLGDQLTRKKLLDLILSASNENVLRAFVQMMRPGMDYEFFQLLSSRIDKSDGEQMKSLTTLREKLLTFTQDLDAIINERMNQARENVNSLTKVEDVKAMIMQNLGAIDQYFIHSLTDELNLARKANDLERSAKLQEVMVVIEELSSNPPEYAILDELLVLAEDEESLDKMLRGITKEELKNLIEMVTNLVGQVKTDDDQPAEDVKSEEQEMLSRLQLIYGAMLKISMENAIEK
ncbi:MAG: hypothetical protein IMY76_00640, partial [Chloroflexi bacterium]|nr:hypothetical protein [Chloroflexota bacterium]